MANKELTFSVVGKEVAAKKVLYSALSKQSAMQKFLHAVRPHKAKPNVKQAFWVCNVVIWIAVKNDVVYA
jgi:hypothetical protein